MTINAFSRVLFVLAIIGMMCMTACSTKKKPAGQKIKAMDTMLIKKRK